MARRTVHDEEADEPVDVISDPPYEEDAEADSSDALSESSNDEDVLSDIDIITYTTDEDSLSSDEIEDEADLARNQVQRGHHGRFRKGAKRGSRTSKSAARSTPPSARKKASRVRDALPEDTKLLSPPLPPPPSFLSIGSPTLFSPKGPWNALSMPKVTLDDVKRFVSQATRPSTDPEAFSALHQYLYPGTQVTLPKHVQDRTASHRMSKKVLQRLPLLPYRTPLDPDTSLSERQMGEGDLQACESFLSDLEAKRATDRHGEDRLVDIFVNGGPIVSPSDTVPYRVGSPAPVPLETGGSKKKKMQEAYKEHYPLPLSALQIKILVMKDVALIPFYNAPFPQSMTLGSDVVYTCHTCLTHMGDPVQASRHETRCRAVHAPGKLVWQHTLPSERHDHAKHAASSRLPPPSPVEGTRLPSDHYFLDVDPDGAVIGEIDDRLDVTDLKIFAVDGADERLYARRLCLLGKLFLDHKTLYYDVEQFLFYVLMRYDPQLGYYRFIGYFSKEKNSPAHLNLSCIVVLPCYATAGYGQYLIDFSYVLSQAELDEMCGPEKPFSELGLIAYAKYWSDAAFAALVDILDKKQVSIEAALHPPALMSPSSDDIEDVLPMSLMSTSPRLRLQAQLKSDPLSSITLQELCQRSGLMMNDLLAVFEWMDILPMIKLAPDSKQKSGEHRVNGRKRKRSAGQRKRSNFIR